MAPSGAAVPTAAPIPPGEQPFVALAGAANLVDLPALPGDVADELRLAETELCGDGSAIAVHATQWIHSGPRAGGLHACLTFRRWLGHEAFDLVCWVTADPDERGLAHVSSLVVRRTDEARLLERRPPLGQWWAAPSLLVASERQSLSDAAAEVFDDPPSGAWLQQDVVPLELDAGSLGTMRGELRIVADLGLAYVSATHGRARALRSAVLDGRLAVPSWIRAYLDCGGDLFALEGGAR